MAETGQTRVRVQGLGGQRSAIHESDSQGCDAPRRLSATSDPELVQPPPSASRLESSSKLFSGDRRANPHPCRLILARRGPWQGTHVPLPIVASLFSPRTRSSTDARSSTAQFEGGRVGGGPFSARTGPMYPRAADVPVYFPWLDERGRAWAVPTANNGWHMSFPFDLAKHRQRGFPATGGFALRLPSRALGGSPAYVGMSCSSLGWSVRDGDGPGAGP